MSSRNVLVFAAGGDAHGTAAQALLGRCRSHPIHERWWLTLMGDAQLRIEHALDLTHNDLAVFVVDVPGLRETYRFRALPHLSGHRIASAEETVTPQDVLHTLSTLGRRDELPQCYALELRSRGVDSVSAERAADVDSAFEFLMNLLDDPESVRWNEQLTEA
ncbi:MAG: hypothetical protein AAF933_01465 [Pseudomonadota bacterium]